MFAKPDELNVQKHRTKKTDREIKNGQSSDSDNSELSTKHRTEKTDTAKYYISYIKMISYVC
jgi:hypothetical protein